MSKYLLGLVNALGQFEPIGLEVRTLKEAKRANAWQRKGHFFGTEIGILSLTDAGKVRVTACDGLGNTYGPAMPLTNSGYKQEAFAAFVATLENPEGWAVAG